MNPWTGRGLFITVLKLSSQLSINATITITSQLLSNPKVCLRIINTVLMMGYKSNTVAVRTYGYDESRIFVNSKWNAGGSLNCDNISVSGWRRSNRIRAEQRELTSTINLSIFGLFRKFRYRLFERGVSILLHRFRVILEGDTKKRTAKYAYKRKKSGI